MQRTEKRPASWGVQLPEFRAEPVETLLGRRQSLPGLIDKLDKHEDRFVLKEYARIGKVCQANQPVSPNTPPVVNLPPRGSMSNLPQVTIYTDGGAVGNPGPGGYGVVMLYNEHRKESPAATG